MRPGADLVSRVHDGLDRLHPGPGPIALAYSGGGDSHALLCIAAAWAHQRGVLLHALTVDHALRPESLAEARLAMAAATRLGARASLLSWQGDKPANGIQAAARQARHTLLAQACRAHDIAHLLLAHTLDDQAETVWMRLQAGGGWRACAGMGESAPSPVWPEGRGVEILRPLLGVRRQALRDYMRAAGERWIEDPSNEDRRYARIRTRTKLNELEDGGFSPDRLAGWADDVGRLERSERRAAAVCGDRAVRFHDWGGAELDLDYLAHAEPVIRRRLVQAVAMAVSGRGAPPRTSALERLLESVSRRGPGSAAGVLLRHWRGGGWMLRDPGAVLGRVDRPGSQSIRVLQNYPCVWDARYEIETPLVNIIAEPLGRAYAGLTDRAVLDCVPGPARPGLLALRRDGEVLAIAGLMEDPRLRITPLMQQRYRARLLCGTETKPDGVLLQSA